MTKIALVTGGKGFLGGNVAKYFKYKGFIVHGIGHGNWLDVQYKAAGFDYWTQSDITLLALQKLNIIPDFIIHCAGSGSVAHSVKDPFKDFERSVLVTASVLEYIRINSPKSKIIYPSSPAVHGVHDSNPIKITDPLAPLSPYGLHKKIAEELCFQYSSNYGLDISIIRFFSIYGPGLKKQLLWDVCNKLISNDNNVAEFWGTGDEIRDWIHVEDSVELIYQACVQKDFPKIINGGSGKGVTVREVISRLKEILSSKKVFCFNRNQKAGDPKFYTADISQNLLFNWSPKINLEEGIQSYVDWFYKETQK